MKYTAELIKLYGGEKMIENDIFRDHCRYHPHKECDLCENCIEEEYNLKENYSEDYEPSDDKIEQMIEEQMLLEEIKVDNL